MIIAVCRATISPGKRSEAQEFWKRLASYNKKQPGIEDVIVMHPLQGLRDLIMASERFSSLEAWEKFREKREEDPEWQALMKERGDKQYTVPVTLEWKQYEVVE